MAAHADARDSGSVRTFDVAGCIPHRYRLG